MKGFSAALLISLAAFASAYPKDRCVCTFMLLPVCASNGVTYANPCEFDCDKRKELNKDLTILHAGQCEEKTHQDLASAEDLCICTLEYLPVCGSDGVTYSNKCSFQCIQKKKQHLKLLHAGQCEEKTEENLPEPVDLCICTLEFLPVCGSDGVTYSNKCSFQCIQKKKQGLKMLYDGQCEEKATTSVQSKDVCLCTKEFLPVCASNGVTYNNKCHFECNKNKNQDLKILHAGQCEEKTIKNLTETRERCMCTKEFLPVCGSDRVTYANPCFFQCIQKKNQDLKLLHYGHCEKKSTENSVQTKDVCICTKEFLPVCGSDGVTYNNPCHFQCKKNKSMKKDLEILHNGECKDESKTLTQSKGLCACNKLFLPVCGSDGVTYPNQCTFQCTKKSFANQDLQITHFGPC